MRLYIIAMMDEAKDLIKNYKHIEEVPFDLYQKDNNLIAISKIGKVNASFVLSYLLVKYQISQIINLGFAGASGNFNVGDIVIVNEAKYHDVDLTLFGYEHGQIPKLPATYKTDINLINLFNYPKSKLYTGDYFMIEKLEGNYLVDMEATALFQVSYLTKTPILSIKVVSDVLGKTTIEEYNSFEEVGSKLILKVYNEIENKL